MKTKAYSIDDRQEMMCSQCDVEQVHKVLAVTKQGTITKAACDTCESVSTFSRGVKTEFATGKGKNASPYDRLRKYRKGQAMMHEKFGRGEVTAVVEPHKIDVLFGNEVRRLIHEQS